MSHLLPMFYEDYFLYWGRLDTSKGETFVLRWLVPRTNLFASFEQVHKYLRRLLDFLVENICSHPFRYAPPARMSIIAIKNQNIPMTNFIEFCKRIDVFTYHITLLTLTL